MSLMDRARSLLRKDRGYRFEGEQANHAEQAAQTATSIGLMAAAAQFSDDDHRIQTMQTEHTLRARQTVLEGRLRNGWKFWLPPAQRSLTVEERGELESIRRSLAELHAPAAMPETVGPRRLAEFGAVGQQPRRFLGAMAGGPLLAIMASPLTWIAAGVAAFGLQTARLNHAKADLAEARHTAEANAQAAHEWRDRYTHDMADAIHTAQAAADALNAERALRTRQAAAERRRLRDLQNVLAHSDSAPEWRLRDDQPATPGAAAPSP